MNSLSEPRKKDHSSVVYRKDIDGLRAIAILAVVSFHFGFLKNGYLGVDVFFVISGYLITKIIYQETLCNKFTLTAFYMRRIRRIIPLVLVTTICALTMGLLFMLPDDLENLSQSVVATNLFSNNILLYITTGDYWNIINDFKPLMHTWSLGIEEQFYLLYPFVFLLFRDKRLKYLLPALFILTSISLILFLSHQNQAATFYLIPYRFFELSAGGIGALWIKEKNILNKLRPLYILILACILLVDIQIDAKILLLISVVSTLLLMVSSGSKFINLMLENKLMIGIGKISFSLYMWHQIVLAFARYTILDNPESVHYLIIFSIILLLSILTYYFIEKPFRNKTRVPDKSLLWIVGIAFTISMVTSLYIYTKGGVIRDVPELDINKSGAERNLNSKYNSRIYSFDNDFSNNKKIKVLVVGDSFARDWANVLCESEFNSYLEISYVEVPFPELFNNCYEKSNRFSQADIIFISATIIDTNQYNKLVSGLHLNIDNIWLTGTKNFGVNNGIFYNRRFQTNYLNERVSISKEYLVRNQSMQKTWGDHYIDLMSKVIDNENKVPVFTPEGKFISQDCKHFTHQGAKYYARLFKDQLEEILFTNKSK